MMKEMLALYNGSSIFILNSINSYSVSKIKFSKGEGSLNRLCMRWLSGVKRRRRINMEINSIH